MEQQSIHRQQVCNYFGGGLIVHGVLERKARTFVYNSIVKFKNMMIMFLLYNQNTANSVNEAEPCDAEKSVIAVRESRQIQRQAERLVIFECCTAPKLTPDLSCKRLRFSGTICSAHQNLTRSEPERCELICYSFT